MNPTRHIELDVDIGADAKDWSAIEAAEKLKPVETELRRIEETIQELVNEMDYLRTREQKLRDTNESTNERVKWFALGTMGMLVGLGVWQIVYLRAYFRYVARPRVVWDRRADDVKVEAFDLSAVKRGSHNDKYFHDPRASFYVHSGNATASQASNQNSLPLRIKEWRCSEAWCPKRPEWRRRSRSAPRY